MRLEASDNMHIYTIDLVGFDMDSQAMAWAQAWQAWIGRGFRLIAARRERVTISVNADEKSLTAFENELENDDMVTRFTVREKA